MECYSDYCIGVLMDFYPNKGHWTRQSHKQYQSTAENLGGSFFEERTSSYRNPLKSLSLTELNVDLIDFLVTQNYSFPYSKQVILDSGTTQYLWSIKLYCLCLVEKGCNTFPITFVIVPRFLTFEVEFPPSGWEPDSLRILTLTQSTIFYFPS